MEDQNNKCLICGISEWNDKPIVLHLDHIDGNNNNFKRENLRFICPNCHSQTDTYCGKNINGNKKVSDRKLLKALIKENNISRALLSCGLANKGGNYKRAKKLAKLI